ncbi:MAG: hypothetical protein AAFQ98_14215 [Bacteroidota bacterium]
MKRMEQSLRLWGCALLLCGWATPPAWSQQVHRLVGAGTNPQMTTLPDGSVAIARVSALPAGYAPADGDPTRRNAPTATFPVFMISTVREGALVSETLVEADLSPVLKGGPGPGYILTPQTDYGKYLLGLGTTRQTLPALQKSYPGLWQDAEPRQEWGRFEPRYLPGQLNVEQVTWTASPYFNRWARSVTRKTVSLEPGAFTGKPFRTVYYTPQAQAYGDQVTVLISEKRKGRENKGSVWRNYRLLTYSLDGALVHEEPVDFVYNRQIQRIDGVTDIATGQEVGPVWWAKKAVVIGGGGHSDPLPERKQLLAAGLDGTLALRYEFPLESTPGEYTLLSPLDLFWHQGQLWYVGVGKVAEARAFMVVKAGPETTEMNSVLATELPNYVNPVGSLKAVGEEGLPGWQVYHRKLLPDGTIVLMGSLFKEEQVQSPGSSLTTTTRSHLGYLVVHLSAEGDLLRQYKMDRGFVPRPGWAPQGMEYLGQEGTRHLFCVWEPLSDPATTRPASDPIPNPGGEPAQLPHQPENQAASQPYLMFFDSATGESGAAREYNKQLRNFQAVYAEGHWTLTQGAERNWLLMLGQVPKPGSEVAREWAVFTLPINP